MNISQYIGGFTRNVDNPNIVSSASGQIKKTMNGQTNRGSINKMLLIGKDFVSDAIGLKMGLLKGYGAILGVLTLGKDKRLGIKG